VRDHFHKCVFKLHPFSAHILASNEACEALSCKFQIKNECGAGDPLRASFMVGFYEEEVTWEIIWVTYPNDSLFPMTYVQAIQAIRSEGLCPYEYMTGSVKWKLYLLSSEWQPTPSASKNTNARPHTCIMQKIQRYMTCAPTAPRVVFAERETLTASGR
jgi:hypothetical protein